MQLFRVAPTPSLRTRRAGARATPLPPGGRRFVGAMNAKPPASLAENHGPEPLRIKNLNTPHHHHGAINTTRSFPRP